MSIIVPIFLIFKIKNTIRIFYKCKHVKFPFLVYFGGPGTALSNTYRTVFIYLKVLSIFLNWKVTPVFALKWSIFRIIVCLVLWHNHHCP